MKVRAFITHKKAEHFQDCQDRFSVNRDTKSVAVSDGMSQSIFQKIWAEILVDAYTKSREWLPSNEPDHSTVKTILSEMWKNSVQNRITEMQKEGKRTYLAERMLVEGKAAGATLVGARFDGCKWYGDVLGDSCLIEIKNSEIERICTSQEGDAFDSHPDFYDSNPLQQGKGVPKALKGELLPGMALLLVSDPFSDFLIEHKKAGDASRYVDEILAVKSHEDFEALVSKWREKYGMHNDDSTLLIIESDDSDELNILSKDNIEKLIEEDSVSVQKTPANPFHRNDSKSDKVSETVLENTNCSKPSDNTPKKGGINLHETLSTKPSSTSNRTELETVVPSSGFVSSIESVVPSNHPDMQELKEKNVCLQNALSEARRFYERAQKDACDREDKYKTLFAEKQNIEKERDSYRKDKETLENENAQLMDEIKKMHDSNEAYKAEINRKNQEIADLTDQLRFAQSSQLVDRSVVRSFCMSEYETFLDNHFLLRKMPGFDQHDVMSEIVSSLLEGYLIIKR